MSTMKESFMDDNKSKALAAALSQIEKQFGKGSIMKMGENGVNQDIIPVSTGSLGLDIARGRPPIPSAISSPREPVETGMMS